MPVGFDKTARRRQAMVGGAVAACEMLHDLVSRRTKAALEIDEGAILVEQDGATATRSCAVCYSAAEAAAMGLVNKVVPDDQLDTEVETWCSEIMDRSPTALAIAKRSFNADSDSIAGIGALGMQALKLYYETDDSKEGVRAFNEKRKPEFRKYAK